MWMLHFHPSIELLSRSNNTVVFFCRHGDSYILLYHITSQGLFWFFNWCDSLSFFFPIRVVSSFGNTFTQIFLLFYSCKYVSMETMLKFIAAAVLYSHLSVHKHHRSTFLHVVTVLQQLVYGLYLKFISVLAFKYTDIICFSLKNSTKPSFPSYGLDIWFRCG